MLKARYCPHFLAGEFSGNIREVYRKGKNKSTVEPSFPTLQSVAEPEEIKEPDRDGMWRRSIRVGQDYGNCGDNGDIHERIYPIDSCQMREEYKAINYFSRV